MSAGAQDSFEIFLWSMQTGRLLEVGLYLYVVFVGDNGSNAKRGAQVLGGHEGPVSSLCFSPVQSILASASWDRTVRLWDMMDSWQVKETLTLTADGMNMFELKPSCCLSKSRVSCHHVLCPQFWP